MLPFAVSRAIKTTCFLSSSNLFYVNEALQGTHALHDHISHVAALKICLFEQLNILSLQLELIAGITKLSLLWPYAR